MNQALRSAALEYAAVSGAFDPMALAGALGLQKARPHRQDLWRGIGPMVTEVCPGASDDGPGYGWMLKPDHRRAWLAQFVSRTQLDGVLKTAPPPWPSDLFGQLLRRLLAGEPVRIADWDGVVDDTRLLARMRHNAALLDAAIFALNVPVLDREALLQLVAAAKQRIQRLQRRRDLTVVLPHRHQGYDRAHRRLSRFLRGGTVDARPVLLTGMGGVGKSALLARLFGHWQRTTDAPVTLILDFDRRQLNGGEPVEVVEELLRQLAVGLAGKLGDPVAEAAAAENLSRMRHNLPKLSATGDQRTHASQFGYLASWLMGPFGEPWAVPLRTLPIALSFDSFEAVDRRGGEVVSTIFELEALLRACLPGLRTVVSGRAAPLDPERVEQYFGPPRRQLELTGLDVADGAQLLADEDRRLAGEGAPILTDARKRRRISAHLGGQPLRLRIFVQYAHSHPGDVDDLLEDLESHPGFQAEFAQVFLYERILERIDDPALRRLAHPGLILRQLSADLIRFVLAGPCLGEGLDDPAPMTAERAAYLLGHLRDEYWLVEPDDPPFGLRHRPDLRREMIPGMFAGPRPGDSPQAVESKRELRARALAVCEAAARYFLDGPPRAAGPDARANWQALDARLRRVNGLYYLGFTRPDRPEPFDAQAAAELDQELRQDVDSMPLAWRARLHVLLGRTPTAAELKTLPADLREIGEQRIFAQEKEQGLGVRRDAPAEEEEPGASRRDGDGGDVAVAGSDDAGASGPAETDYRQALSGGSAASPDRAASAIERDIERAFAGAQFDRVAELAPDYFDALEQRSEEETDRRFREAESQGYWSHPMWQVLLVTGAGLRAHETAAVARAAQDRKSLYMPVYAAMVAAADGDPDAVHAALRPVLDRDLLSPIDFNRARGRKMADVMTGRYDEELAFYPASLCLFAGTADGAFDPSLLSFLMIENDALLESLKTDIHSLGRIGRAYELASAQGLKVADPKNQELMSMAFRSDRWTTGAVLRGLTPDLYAPLLHPFSGLGSKEVQALAEELRGRARFWPEELRFDQKRAFNRRQAPTIVETADQCGVLRDLIGILMRFDPDLAPLAEMYDCVSRWFFPFFAADVA